MRPTKKAPPPDGQLRRSQMLTNAGPGALVDLPHDSVVISGTDSWPKLDGTEIDDPRLLAKIQDFLKRPNIVLRKPPTPKDPKDAGAVTVPIHRFPNWFVVDATEEDVHSDGIKRRIVGAGAVTRTKAGWVLTDKSDGVRSASPMRFVRACARGHLDDVPWASLAHKDRAICRDPKLFLVESGTGGDLRDLTIVCESCNTRVRISALAMRDASHPILSHCNGRTPWLPENNEPCAGKNGEGPLPFRLLVRNSSNAYFSVTQSALSLPEADPLFEQAFELDKSHWLHAQTRQVFDTLFGVPTMFAATRHYGAERVWAAIEARRNPAAVVETPLRLPEFEALYEGYRPVDDGSHQKFRAEAVPVPALLADHLAKVVVVPRLREVIAQVGFTRFEPLIQQKDGELDLEIDTAPLGNANFVPAVENFGEGFFLALKPDVVEAWMKRAEVHETHLAEAHASGEARRGGRERPFHGIDYVLLHSLSHALLQQVSEAAGYAASSLKERIYAFPKERCYGLLIYTATGDSEGTLGGLVEVGRRLELHLREALRRMPLCSNDPVCADHDPADARVGRFTHGAACHGCLLVSESACERGNAYLDRAVLTETIAHSDFAFFRRSFWES